MVDYNKIIAWKWLKTQLERIGDTVLRKAMLAEFRKRAFDSWGYNPDTAFVKKCATIELDEWEKEFVADIEKANKYEIDTREEKRKKTETEAHSRMSRFIELGGQLSEIPDNVRSKTIEKLYRDCLLEYGDQLFVEADNFIKKVVAQE